LTEFSKIASLYSENYNKQQNPFAVKQVARTMVLTETYTRNIGNKFVGM